MRRLLLLVVCCGLLATASGCLGALDDASNDRTVPTIEDGDDVQEAIRTTSDDLTTITGTKVKERHEFGNETTTNAIEFQTVVDEAHATTIESEAAASDTRKVANVERQVSTAESTWLYWPERETAIEIEGGPIQPFELSLREWLRDADLEYRGTERVAGHETHRVQVDSFGPANVTSGFEYADTVHVWLDDEYFYPVQWTLVQDGPVRNVTHTELRLDADIDSGAFAFEPPEHVTVRNKSALEYDGDTGQSYANVSAADAETPFPIAVPDSLPEGYERSGVRVSTLGLDHSATVRYRDGSGSSLQVRTRMTRPLRTHDAQPLSFDDRRAFVYELQYGAKSIAWTCDRLWYELIGSADVEDLRGVVESTDCR